jgi:hypothetical protein
MKRSVHKFSGAVPSLYCMSKNFLTTKRTKDTKVSEISYPKLRDLRVLRGESLLCVLCR